MPTSTLEQQLQSALELKKVHLAAATVGNSDDWRQKGLKHCEKNRLMETKK